VFAELVGDNRNGRQGLRVVHMCGTKHADRASIGAFDLIGRNNERTFVEVLHTGFMADSNPKTTVKHIFDQGDHQELTFEELEHLSNGLGLVEDTGDR